MLVLLVLIAFASGGYQLLLKSKPDPHHYIWFEKPQKKDGSASEAVIRDIVAKLQDIVRCNPKMRKLYFWLTLLIKE